VALEYWARMLAAEVERLRPVAAAARRYRQASDGVGRAVALVELRKCSAALDKTADPDED